MLMSLSTAWIPARQPYRLSCKSNYSKRSRYPLWHRVYGNSIQRIHPRRVCFCVRTSDAQSPEAARVPSGDPADAVEGRHRKTLDADHTDVDRRHFRNDVSRALDS